MSKRNHLKLVADNPTSQIERPDTDEPFLESVPEPHVTKKHGGMLTRLAQKAKSAGEAIDESLINTPGSRRDVRIMSEALRARAGEKSVANTDNTIVQDLFDTPIAETSDSEVARQFLNTIIVSEDRRVYGLVNEIDETNQLSTVSLVRLPFGQDAVLPNERAGANPVLVKQISATKMVERDDHYGVLNSNDGFSIKVNRHSEEIDIVSSSEDGVVVFGAATFAALEQNYPMAGSLIEDMQNYPNMWAGIQY